MGQHQQTLLTDSLTVVSCWETRTLLLVSLSSLHHFKAVSQQKCVLRQRWPSALIEVNDRSYRVREHTAFLWKHTAASCIPCETCGTIADLPLSGFIWSPLTRGGMRNPNTPGWQRANQMSFVVCRAPPGQEGGSIMRVRWEAKLWRGFVFIKTLFILFTDMKSLARISYYGHTDDKFDMISNHNNHIWGSSSPLYTR